MGPDDCISIKAPHIENQSFSYFEYNDKIIQNKNKKKKSNNKYERIIGQTNRKPTKCYVHARNCQFQKIKKKGEKIGNGVFIL